MVVEHFDGLVVAGLSLALVLAVQFSRQATTALMTLRARALTPVLLRRLARWVKVLDYSGAEFFAADGAGESWIQTRRDALLRLAGSLREQHSQSAAWSDALRQSFSDLRFTDANRVPFPFARVMREQFNLSTVVTASSGPALCDRDGRWSLDVGGSYGVNVAAVDRYKAWIEKGWERVKALGPALGPLHLRAIAPCARIRPTLSCDAAERVPSGVPRAADGDSGAGAAGARRGLRQLLALPSRELMGCRVTHVEI